MCDGTFKSAPQYNYQHYIIHGKYIGWPLPGSFSFLSGKSTEIFNQMLPNLKEEALEVGLTLKPKMIAVDFELAAISAFKLHFSNA